MTEYTTYGDLLSLILLSTLYFYLRRAMALAQTFKENAFRHFVLGGILFYTISIVTHLCALQIIPCFPILNKILCRLHALSFPIITFLWLHYVTAHLPLKKRVFEVSRHILLVLPLTILCLISVVDLFTGAFYIFGVDNHMIAGIARPYIYQLTIFYGVVSIIEVVFNRKKLPKRSQLQFLLPTTLLMMSAVAMFIHKHFFFSLSISFIVTITYLAMQDRKILYDTFTGIMNQRAFQARMETELKRKDSGCVLIIDIKNFKYFNQKYGRVAGNELLLFVVDFLTNSIAKRRVFRYGGDQFAIILNSTNEEHIYKTIQKIRGHFSQPIHIKENPVNIYFHMGLLFFPNQAKTSEEVMSALEYSLQEAKILHDGKAIRYDAHIIKKQQRKHLVAEILQHINEEGTVELHFQPIFNPISNKIIAAEALMRIHDGMLGDISPEEFIPIAEETELIIGLTYQVIQQVCELLHKINRGQNKLQTISINLSARNFLQPDMAEQIMKILRNNGIDPASISFELTESMIVNSFDRVKEVMDDLSQHGITFAMDDYGSGYSNIDYLINLPFSTVKLDRSVICTIDEHPVLLESIALMLAKLGKHTVAEGVETKEQLEAVESAGIQSVQGFYFSRPLPADVFMELLSANSRSPFAQR
jgi:diguanylate cyclase